jgi:uncharacterized protein DUF5994
MTTRMAASAAVVRGPLPRLRWEPTVSRTTLLDGAWWPHSDDLLAELPDLVLALDRRRGPVTHLMLGASSSDSHPTRLAVAGRRVRLGWFASQPAGLLTAICGDRERIDLLVVPPATDPTAAGRAMATAAETTNTLHTTDILATLTHPAPAGTSSEGDLT